MPSSQNDIGLFSNQLTERLQQQVNIGAGAVFNLVPPAGFANVPLIVMIQAQGGGFRYTANAAQLPSTTFGILITDTGVLSFIPADPTIINVCRNGADPTFINVAWYTFANVKEV